MMLSYKFQERQNPVIHSIIMSREESPLINQIKKFREERAWSQQELAERAGLSRAGVSAIETGKLVPSTVAALALAKVFGCSVEDLFKVGGPTELHWAWPPSQPACRYWRAMVSGKLLLYPVEQSPLGMVPHDGVFRDGKLYENPFSDPHRTLVMASCDPAAGLLAAEYARSTPYRMLVLSRASRTALELLRDGLVHVAGLHLARSSAPEKNNEAARELLTVPFTLVRLVDWQEGLVLAPGLGQQGVDRILESNLRWIGREAGSGARQVLDELLGSGTTAPALTARSHLGVVEAIRAGWAEAGISVKLMSDEAGLDFIALREEAFDLCIPEPQGDDPRVRALVEVVRSAPLKTLLAGLPGYDVKCTGEMS